MSNTSFLFCSSWKAGTFSNDLALIKISRKGNGQGIQFSENVGPACLPTSDTNQEDGTECIVSGWGKIDSKNTKSISILI